MTNDLQTFHDDLQTFYDDLIEIGLRYHPHDDIQIELDDDGIHCYINANGYRVLPFKIPKNTGCCHTIHGKSAQGLL